jgi:heat shock protein HslJ
MRHLLLILTITFSSLSCFSGNKSALTDRDWGIRQIKFSGAADWVTLPGTYRLSFSDNNQASIRLDVNTCFGDVEIGTRSIDLNLTACTEACCDSEIALQMLQSLYRVDQYTIKGDSLRLYGPDTILAFPLR